ncbi:hypothetical protein [Paenibacillus caui]|uniref:hypothetical protein n=1 Tax=Paenibacillus caui TaxID=2873927 RepID=UPI001CA7DECB|nr:hypothetical protein [Paenibacillus caui]
MECTVYFDVVHEDDAKELRGLIFLEEGKTPTEQDFLSMFEEMGYKLRLEDRERLTFAPVDAGADYKEIRVRRLDTGDDDKQWEDNNLKSLIGNLLPNKPKSI